MGAALEHALNMVLISLSPPRVRKYLCSLTACIAFSAVSCFAETTYFAVDATPYDHQMIRVVPVLASTHVAWADQVSVLIVNYWMSQLRAKPYRYSRRWQTPAEVEAAEGADCKGKAVALYAQMRASGAQNVRIIIGKRRHEDAATHAWLEWETRDATYLLDPTFNSMALRMEQEDPFSYIPFYVYEGGSKYRAGSTNYLGQQTPMHSPSRNLPSVALAPTKRPAMHSSARAQVCAKVSAKITK
jgi:hypothetical protein